MKHYKKPMNDPYVHLHLDAPRALQYSTKKSPLLNVKTLRLSHVTITYRRSDGKNATKLITLSPNLTRLFLEDIHGETIMQWAINELCGDILLNLNHLSIVECCSFMGELPVLVKSEWPNFTNLSLLETPVSEDDLEFLCLACNGPKKNLPNLTSLCLTVPKGMSTDVFYAKFFMLSWLKLKQLYVDYKFDSNTRGLSDAIRDRKLSNLDMPKNTNSHHNTTGNRAPVLR